MATENLENNYRQSALTVANEKTTELSRPENFFCKLFGHVFPTSLRDVNNELVMFSLKSSDGTYHPFSAKTICKRCGYYCHPVKLFIKDNEYSLFKNVLKSELVSALNVINNADMKVQIFRFGSELIAVDSVVISSLEEYHMHRTRGEFSKKQKKEIVSSWKQLTFPNQEQVLYNISLSEIKERK